MSGSENQVCRVYLHVCFIQEIEYNRGGSDSEYSVLDDNDVDHDYIQLIDEESDENLVEERSLLWQRDSAESRQPR